MCLKSDRMRNGIDRIKNSVKMACKSLKIYVKYVRKQDEDVQVFDRYLLTLVFVG